MMISLPWVAILTAVSTSLVVCCIASLVVLIWKFNKEHSLTRSGDDNYKQRSYTYFTQPSTTYRNEFDQGIPCGAIEAVNVQPDWGKLNLKALTMRTSSTFSNESGFEIPIFPEIYQTPVISTYDCEKKTDPVWKRTAKKNLVDSYKKTTYTSAGTIEISTSGKPITNVNFVQNEGPAEPELEFSIFYDSPTKDLHVTVIRASSLPVSKWFEKTKSTQHFRVKVRVEPWETQWRTTRLVSGTRGPIFGETFITSGLVHHKLRECTVHFVVVDFEEYQHCWTVVGEVVQSMIDCRANQLIKATKKCSKFDNYK